MPSTVPGWAPPRPAGLAKSAPAGPVGGGVARLLGDYAARRMSARAEVPRHAYAYGAFASGVAIPQMVRRCFRDRHSTWSGDPFAQYDDYLRLPNPRAVVGVFGETVTNLMQQHHASSPELRFAFDLATPFGASNYARFFARMAAADGIDPSLWRAAAS